MKAWTMWLLAAFTCLSLVTVVDASQTIGYDVTTKAVGGVSAATTNVTYTCSVTNTWTSSRHPADYPSNPQLRPPLMVSHSRRYRLWMPGTRASTGMRTYISTGNPDALLFSILTTDNVFDEQLGELQNVLSVIKQTLPPIHVDKQHPYLTTMVPFSPSPDWFSGFYAFSTIDRRSNTFLELFTINVYPWDGGTRNGTTYSSPGSAIAPAIGIAKITLQTAPTSNAFLDPERSSVLPVATWECHLSV